MKAVRFSSYGDVDVLDLQDVDDPVATPGHVVVRVRAAAANPGDIYVRQGLAEQAWALCARLSGAESDVPRWSMSFPAGQGQEFAGEIVEVGREAGAWHVGDQVLGWSEKRESQAEYVAVAAEHLVSKPARLSWEVAGSMFIAPMAGLASVEAVSPAAGETVVISGAAGAVGIVAAQLALRREATVVGWASQGNPVDFGPSGSSRSPTAMGARRAYGRRQPTALTRSSTPTAPSMWTSRTSSAYRRSGSTPS